MTSIKNRRILNSILLATLTMAGLAVVPTAPAQTSEPTPYAVDDGAGDVSVFQFLAPPAPAPATPVTDPLDIDEAGIYGEDDMGFRVYLKAVNLKGDPTATQIFFGQSSYQYHFSARLEGTQITYDLWWFVEPPGPTATAPTGVQPVAARFCFNPANAPAEFREFSCERQNVQATVDWDQSRLEAYLTKSALMGNDPLKGRAPTQFPPTLAKGSQLGGVVFEAERQFPNLYDRAPNQGDGSPYSFQAEAANTKIRLRLDTLEEVAGGTSDPFGDFGTQTSSNSNQISVSPGLPGLVSLRVENTRDSKRIINLSAAVESATSQNDWKVQIVPSVQVPAGDARVVNLIINASSTVQHRDSAIVIVRGRSLGVSDELAALRLDVVASVPPGPERQTLFFHARGFEGGGDVDKAICTAFRCGSIAWLNTLESDATADMDDGFPMGRTEFFFAGGQQGFGETFALDTPLTQALMIDSTKPIEAVLAFNADTEFNAEVAVEVSTPSGIIVASSSAAAAIKAGSVVNVQLVALKDTARIPAEEGGLEVSIFVSTPTAGPGAAANLPGFQFVPRSSRITFPFIADPQSKMVRFSSGPALVSLNALGDTEEFVNPGRTKAFNVSVVNEGLEADDVDITYAASDPDWSVEVRPGIRFHLSPGDGAKFGILVKAPADAKEGEQVQVMVNATSVKDANAVSSILLVAIVTSALDIGDDAATYQADAESAGKVASTGKADTPAPAALLVVGALLVPAGLAARRRRK